MNTARYRYPTGITIAGSDSCGGAGIQADLKTFSALGVYGMSVITAITAQNTKKICGIQAVDAEVIKNQIDLLFEDFEVDAVKIGMVYRAETVSILADALRRYRPRWIVLDPVLISTSGNQLLEDAAVESMVSQLFPLANLVTPNIPETEFLTRRPIRSENDFEQAAQAFLQMGCSAVLIKGGHGEGKNKTDRYFSKEGENRLFVHPTIESQNTHGTGCTLSSAIAAFLALGNPMPLAIEKAENYLAQAIEAGREIILGHGHGPVNHFFNPEKLKTIELSK